jgi:uncharacterized protein
MNLSGTYRIDAAPATVWNALNDPDVLKACIPGCETVEKTASADFMVAAVLKIGPMKARFKGKVTLTDQDPPRRCVVRGEGEGGAAGFAKGEAEVLLTDETGTTILTYAAKATVGGKLAQIGQRLIDGAAKQIADEFFGRFADELTQRNIGTVERVAPAVSSRAVPKSWIVGIVIVVAVLVLLIVAATA